MWRLGFNGTMGAPDVAAWRAAVMQLEQNIALSRLNRGYPYP